PVLLDFGLLQPQGTTPWGDVTSAYRSIAQSSTEPAEAWMDLHGLGVTALTLLTGRCPEELWKSDVRVWVWPESFELDGSFLDVLQRMLSEAPDQRFEKASDVISALQAVIMPESIGPNLIADRPLALAPQAVPLSDHPSRTSQSLLTEHRSANQPRRRRAEEREQAAEGRLWSVVGALLASALVGTAIGWFLLSRSSPLGMDPVRDRDLVGNVPVESPSAVEVDHRQQLLSRLRALQVKQSWFLQLVDASVLARFPYRGGRFPSDALDDVPLRQAWNDLAEEWLVRIEQLSPQLRRRLGELKNADWQEQREGLSELGVHGRVIEQLVTAGAQKLLLGSFNDQKPPEPYLQFWYAAALRSLADVQIETLKVRPSTPTEFSSRVSPGAARLISLQVPAGHRLVLEIKGTPLMQMTIYGSQGDVIAERGSLRVVTLEPEAGSPVQVLVTNEGLATARLILSCR
ncbi:MAG: serine/threonine protein kinase, partial [Cyanobacteriota bacterium]|nr:serine/threonine protein kinase [Cyanobacteriota bacterium]